MLTSCGIFDVHPIHRGSIRANQVVMVIRSLLESINGQLEHLFVRLKVL